MKIYDHDTKRVLNRVTLFLTPSEARELGDSAQDLAEKPEHHHHHVCDSDYKQEIIVSVYTPANLNQFDAESRAVISGKTDNNSPEPTAKAAAH